MNKTLKNIVISIIVSIVLTSVIGLLNSSLKITGNEIKGFNIQSDILRWEWNWGAAFAIFLEALLVLYLFGNRIKSNPIKTTDCADRGIAFGDGPRIPLFKSKSKPGTFYYVTIGRKPSVADIESGKARINLPAMKYISQESYESYVGIPNSLVDDMEIVVSHCFKKGIFSVLNGDAYGEATVYVLEKIN